MLRTGSRGFTLIEVMVATAVLAFGTVMVFEAFFVSANTYASYERYLKASAWMPQKLWEVEQAVMQYGDAASLEPDGRVVLSGKQFDWRVTSESMDQESGLYRILLEVSWSQGVRRPRLLRGAYVIHPQKSREEGQESG
ncbi:MAG: prepilin-type N-terminal cleavage/methylation domain-containing protein [Candidatus Omnitrophica bacterium]|nr:prepilin-type N-terminal cleavage/methylation domain-containing protein [Candidatus Omnitrophota bacterium]